MHAHMEPSRPDEATAWLLRAGASAGPFYILVGLVQILTREGFDVRRHALSLLSNGEMGWIQMANFFVSGALVSAGAVGLRRKLQGRPAGTWGPLLLIVYGIGLVGAGIFRADPGRGFPPGSPENGVMTQAGLLHFVCGGVGFYALIAACFVFARAFSRGGDKPWMAYSLLSGVGFFVAFAGVASGSTATATMLAFYAAVAWIWIWHALLHQRVQRF